MSSESSRTVVAVVAVVMGSNSVDDSRQKIAW